MSKINSGPYLEDFYKRSNLSENRLTDQTVALLIKEIFKFSWNR